MSVDMRVTFDRWRELFLLIIGVLIIQFFIGLVMYQIGWENRSKFNNEQLNASIAFDYCIKHKRIKYGNDIYSVHCYLDYQGVKK